jgi:hypothetical protein
MVAIACPWCEEDAFVRLAELEEIEDFVCDACGTSVALEDEATALDLAA